MTHSNDLGAGPPPVPQKLTVVIPCHNESEAFSECLRRVKASCSEQSGWEYEIVFVNDGSTDATWDNISDAARHDPHVVGVNLSRNFGHQIALTAGLSICRGERIFILDADLQDPPELLEKMMKRMDAGADVVYGQRLSRDGESLFKRMTAIAFYRFLNFLSDLDIPKDTGDFRLINRSVLETLLSMPETDRFIRGMISWVGFRQEALPYQRAKRIAGKSKYPINRMVRFSIDAITGFSIRPMRIASIFGLILAIFTLLMLAWTLYSWFVTDTAPGWASLMTVILLIGSVQMLVLGIIGEYLGRLFMQSKQRPLFVIQETVGSVDKVYKTPQRGAA